jgi:putative sterol carrier protein
MHDGRAAPAPTSDQPSVTLTMDQEAFWRLGFGRVEPTRLVATGEVRVEGDMALGHKVLDSMAFIV